MRSTARWIRWSLEYEEDEAGNRKATKKPHGSIYDRKRWMDWETAKTQPRTVGHGIGFNFAEPVENETHRLMAFDLDACRDKDTGVIEQWAVDFVKHCGHSYTEVTPSGQGLRTFVWVPKATSFHKTRFWPIGAARPAGTTKKIECQAFGDPDHAGYVTVTGDHLPGSTAEPVQIDDLSWFGPMFGRLPGDGPKAGDATELPKGFEPLPTVAEVAQRVRSTDEGRKLADHEIDKEQFPSDSEAFAALTRVATTAAYYDGELVKKFLLRECPRWSDPGVKAKFSREDWVVGDLLRTMPSKPPFTALPPEPVTAPATVAISTDGLLVPAGEFARGAAQQLFLVKNLIARTGVTQFFGDPASGKTPFVMSLAITVANGAATWFGRKVMRKGVVIYMVGEDRAGVGHRLLAECKARGIDPDELGKTLLFTTKPGQLMSAEDTQRWVLAIQRAAAGREVALVVVDTQAQNFGPGDENAFKDMNQFLHNLEAMTGVLDCAIAMVHHTGHMNKDRGRGHSAMEGFLTSRFEVVKSELENGTVVTTASDHKHKNWEKPEPLRGTLVPVVRYTDEDGEVVTAITLQEQGVSIFDNEDDVVAVVKALVDRGAETSIRALATAVDRHHRDVVKALRKAVTAGLISESKGKGGKISYPVTALGLEAVCKGSVQVRQNGWRTPNSEVSAPSEMAHLGAPKLDKSVTDALD